MTSVTIPDGMPQLAKGSHPRGSGRACIMNYLSYLNGDGHVVDRPSCTHRALAMAAVWLNDNLCSHGTGDLICQPCSVILLGFAGRLYGTGDAELSDADAVRVSRGLIAWTVASYPLKFPELQSTTKHALAAYGAGLIDYQTFDRSIQFSSGTDRAAVQAMRTDVGRERAADMAADVVSQGTPYEGSLRTDGIIFLDGLLTAHERLTAREAPYVISPEERTRVTREIATFPRAAAFPHIAQLQLLTLAK